VIEPVDEGDELVVRGEVRGLRLVPVADNREFAELRVQKVHGDVLHLPAGGYSLSLPVLRTE